VLKGFLRAVPVDENWYTAEYPAVADFLLRMPTETPASHFQKHGYFEGRKPFAPGSPGLTAPVPFAQLKPTLGIIPSRGRLRVVIERADFLQLIKSLLMAVPVDEPWYRSRYPDVAKTIYNGTTASAATHYIESGYLDGRLPSDVTVDEEWYISRYDHVRTGLDRGVACSAKDHFMRLGYNEGCRPIPP
jgi:hypothetical protein